MGKAINLKDLTDRELSELKKKIDAERESRKDSLSYKSNLPFGEDRFHVESQLINHYVNKKGFHGFGYDAEKALHSPIWKIQASVFHICDYILGNFKCLPCATGDGIRLTCEGSRIWLDDKEEYLAMYNELYSVIDKWVDKKTVDLGGRTE